MKADMTIQYKKCPMCNMEMHIARKDAKHINEYIPKWKCINLDCPNERQYPIRKRLWLKICRQKDRLAYERYLEGDDPSELPKQMGDEEII